MNKLIISSLLILFSAAIAVPAVKAEKAEESPVTETRTEELQQEVEEPLETEESPEDFEEEAEDEAQTRTEDVQQSVEIEESLETGESLEGLEEEAEDEAQTRTEDVQQNVEENSSSSAETDAFEFVNSAYQGQYEEQGIPGFDELFSAYTTGELTAEKLVMMGVENGILSSEMMDDEAYINGVDLQLQSLENS